MSRQILKKCHYFTSITFVHCCRPTVIIIIVFAIIVIILQVTVLRIKCIISVIITSYEFFFISVLDRERIIIIPAILTSK